MHFTAAPIFIITPSEFLPAPSNALLTDNESLSALKFISVSDVHAANASVPSDVTFLGTVTLSSPLQYLNALGPIDFTVSGSVSLFKFVQPLKAFAPIVLIPSGIIAWVNSTPANAFAAMAFTLPSSGIALSVKP